MKLLIRKSIKYLLALFGMLYRLIDKKENEIIFLMYHRVNDNINKELSVKYSNFLWQMEYLKRKKYKVISIDEAFKLIRLKEINNRYIVLTFDDGYEDFYTNAYPILYKMNFPSIIYLVPGFINTDKVFWWDQDIGESKLMNWSQLYKLSNSSILSIGSHTINHYDLDKLNEKELITEIEISKIILEKKLNKEIKHFSYPRGIFNDAAGQVVRQIYDTGVLIFNGENITNDLDKHNLIKIKRIPVQRSDGRYLFVARVKGWLIIEEIIRKIGFIKFVFERK